MKNKILYGIAALVIILGIIMYFVHGINVGNVYGENTKIGLYIENGVNVDEVKTIVSESFNGKEAIYQDIEYFGEMVLITLPTVTDEEVDNFLAKVNEKYELEYDKEDLDITKMPSVDFVEVIRPYLLPVLLTLVLTGVYLAIRYRKLGISKMIVALIATVAIVESVIVSIYVIANIPVDISIIPVSLFGLGIALVYTTVENNRLLEIKHKELAEQEEKATVKE